LAFLAKVEDERLTLAETLEQKPPKAVALVAPEGVEAYLPLAGLVDLEQETARLTKALADTNQEIQRAEAKLSNEGFLSKAPAHVVQQQRDRLAEQRERRTRLEARLQALEE
jgi:valyl-tRNA synthetase